MTPLQKLASLKAEDKPLEEPALDPMMLLAAMMTGGLTGAGGKGLREMAQAALKSEDTQFLRDILQNIIGENPSALKATGSAAKRFLGLDALNNLVSPKHPKRNNILSLLSVPDFPLPGPSPVIDRAPGPPIDAFERYKDLLFPYITGGLLATYPQRSK